MVTAREIKKGLLFELPGAREAMYAELKRNLLVGARAFPDWYSELDGFEIHEERGQLVLGQVSQRTLLVKVRLSRERDGLHAPLLFI